MSAFITSSILLMTGVLSVVTAQPINRLSDGGNNSSTALNASAWSGEHPFNPGAPELPFALAGTNLPLANLRQVQLGNRVNLGANYSVGTDTGGGFRPVQPHGDFIFEIVSQGAQGGHETRYAGTISNPAQGGLGSRNNVFVDLRGLPSQQEVVIFAGTQPTNHSGGAGNVTGNANFTGGTGGSPQYRYRAGGGGGASGAIVNNNVILVAGGGGGAGTRGFGTNYGTRRYIHAGIGGAGHQQGGEVTYDGITPQGGEAGGAGGTNSQNGANGALHSHSGDCRNGSNSTIWVRGHRGGGGGGGGGHSQGNGGAAGDIHSWNNSPGCGANGRIRIWLAGGGGGLAGSNFRATRLDMHGQEILGVLHDNVSAGDEATEVRSGHGVTEIFRYIGHSAIFNLNAPTGADAATGSVLGRGVGRRGSNMDSALAMAGTSIDGASLYVPGGTHVHNVANPTLPGWTFRGWFRTSAGPYAGTDALREPVVHIGGIAPQNNTPFSGRLYAHWERNNLQVHFARGESTYIDGVHSGTPTPAQQNELRTVGLGVLGGDNLEFGDTVDWEQIFYSNIPARTPRFGRPGYVLRGFEIHVANITNNTAGLQQHTSWGQPIGLWNGNSAWHTAGGDLIDQYRTISWRAGFGSAQLMEFTNTEIMQSVVTSASPPTDASRPQGANGGLLGSCDLVNGNAIIVMRPLFTTIGIMITFDANGGVENPESTLPAAFTHSRGTTLISWGGANVSVHGPNHQPRFRRDGFTFLHYRVEWQDPRAGGGQWQLSQRLAGAGSGGVDTEAERRGIWRAADGNINVGNLLGNTGAGANLQTSPAYNVLSTELSEHMPVRLTAVWVPNNVAITFRMGVNLYTSTAAADERVFTQTFPFMTETTPGNFEANVITGQQIENLLTANNFVRPGYLFNGFAIGVGSFENASQAIADANAAGSGDYRFWRNYEWTNSQRTNRRVTSRTIGFSNIEARGATPAVGGDPEIPARSGVLGAESLRFRQAPATGNPVAYTVHLTLVARWIPMPWDIHFYDDNGNRMNATNIRNYENVRFHAHGVGNVTHVNNARSSYTILPRIRANVSPANQDIWRDGYTFMGWFASNEPCLSRCGTLRNPLVPGVYWDCDSCREVRYIETTRTHSQPTWTAALAAGTLPQGSPPIMPSPAPFVHNFLNRGGAETEEAHAERLSNHNFRFFARWTPNQLRITYRSGLNFSGVTGGDVNPVTNQETASPDDGVRQFQRYHDFGGTGIGGATIPFFPNTGRDSGGNVRNANQFEMLGRTFMGWRISGTHGTSRPYDCWDGSISTCDGTNPACHGGLHGRHWRGFEYGEYNELRFTRINVRDTETVESLTGNAIRGEVGSTRVYQLILSDGPTGPGQGTHIDFYQTLTTYEVHLDGVWSANRLHVSFNSGNGMDVRDFDTYYAQNPGDIGSVIGTSEVQGNIQSMVLPFDGSFIMPSFWDGTDPAGVDQSLSFQRPGFRQIGWYIFDNSAAFDGFRWDYENVLWECQDPTHVGCTCSACTGKTAWRNSGNFMRGWSLERQVEGWLSVHSGSAQNIARTAEAGGERLSNSDFAIVLVPMWEADELTIQFRESYRGHMWRWDSTSGAFAAGNLQQGSTTVRRVPGPHPRELEDGGQFMWLDEYGAGNRLAGNFILTRNFVAPVPYRPGSTFVGWYFDLDMNHPVVPLRFTGGTSGFGLDELENRIDNRDPRSWNVDLAATRLHLSPQIGSDAAAGFDIRTNAQGNQEWVLPAQVLSRRVLNEIAGLPDFQAPFRLYARFEYNIFNIDYRNMAFRIQRNEASRRVYAGATITLGSGAGAFAGEIVEIGTMMPYYDPDPTVMDSFNFTNGGGVLMQGNGHAGLLTMYVGINMTGDEPFEPIHGNTAFRGRWINHAPGCPGYQTDINTGARSNCNCPPLLTGGVAPVRYHVFGLDTEFAVPSIDFTNFNFGTIGGNFIGNRPYTFDRQGNRQPMDGRYRFEGWFMAHNGDGALDVYPELNPSNPNIGTDSVFTLGGEDFNQDTPIRLFARWGATYTITFEDLRGQDNPNPSQFSLADLQEHDRGMPIAPLASFVDNRGVRQNFMHWYISNGSRELIAVIDGERIYGAKEWQRVVPGAPFIPAVDPVPGLNPQPNIFWPLVSGQRQLQNIYLRAMWQAESFNIHFRDEINNFNDDNVTHQSGAPLFPRPPHNIPNDWATEFSQTNHSDFRCSFFDFTFLNQIPRYRLAGWTEGAPDGMMVGNRGITGSATFYSAWRVNTQPLVAILDRLERVDLSRVYEVRYNHYIELVQAMSDARAFIADINTNRLRIYGQSNLLLQDFEGATNSVRYYFDNIREIVRALSIPDFAVGQPVRPAVNIVSYIRNVPVDQNGNPVGVVNRGVLRYLAELLEQYSNAAYISGFSLGVQLPYLRDRAFILQSRVQQLSTAPNTTFIQIINLEEEVFRFFRYFEQRVGADSQGRPVFSPIPTFRTGDNFLVPALADNRNGIFPMGATQTEQRNLRRFIAILEEYTVSGSTIHDVGNITNTINNVRSRVAELGTNIARRDIDGMKTDLRTAAGSHLPPSANRIPFEVFEGALWPRSNFTSDRSELVEMRYRMLEYQEFATDFDQFTLPSRFPAVLMDINGNLGNANLRRVDIWDRREDMFELASDLHGEITFFQSLPGNAQFTWLVNEFNINMARPYPQNRQNAIPSLPISNNNIAILDQAIYALESYAVYVCNNHWNNVTCICNMCDLIARATAAASVRHFTIHAINRRAVRNYTARSLMTQAITVAEDPSVGGQIGTFTVGGRNVPVPIVVTATAFTSNQLNGILEILGEYEEMYRTDARIANLANLIATVQAAIAAEEHWFTGRGFITEHFARRQIRELVGGIASMSPPIQLSPNGLPLPINSDLAEYWRRRLIRVTDVLEDALVNNLINDTGLLTSAMALEHNARQVIDNPSATLTSIRNMYDSVSATIAGLGLNRCSCCNSFIPYNNLLRAEQLVFTVAILQEFVDGIGRHVYWADAAQEEIQNLRSLLEHRNSQGTILSTNLAIQRAVEGMPGTTGAFERLATWGLMAVNNPFNTMYPNAPSLALPQLAGGFGIQQHLFIELIRELDEHIDERGISDPDDARHQRILAYRNIAFQALNASQLGDLTEHQVWLSRWNLERALEREGINLRYIPTFPSDRTGGNLIIIVIIIFAILAIAGGVTFFMYRYSKKQGLKFSQVIPHLLKKNT